MGHSRPLFQLFSSFRTVQLLKNVAASGIRTRIVRAVGENADHYATTTAQVLQSFYLHLDAWPQSAKVGTGWPHSQQPDNNERQIIS